MQYVGPSDQVVTLSQYSALLHLPTLPFPVMLERLIRGLQGGEPHPPLFFMAHHLWLHGFGAGEIALRSLPLLWSLGAIAVAYGLGRLLSGHRFGLMFCTLLAANPFYLFHSLNMRMYTPLVFWAILSAWALMEIRQQIATSLASHFKLTGQQSLSGTMDLDRFELSVYQSNDRT